MEKNSEKQKQIGGFDEDYMKDLDPNDPDFVEKYIEKVMAPIEDKKNNDD